MSVLRYWVDDMGGIWKGPVAPESTMHYAMLDGMARYGELCWTIQRSAEPENAEEITEEQAEKISERYRNSPVRMG